MAHPLITSLQNQRVKNAIKLRNHRERERTNRFLIDGDREIDHALAAGIEVDHAFVCPEMCQDPDQSIADLQHHGAEILTVTRAVWDKLNFGQRRNGRIVIAQPPKYPLEDFDPGNQGLIVILESIEKPGNIGAVIRTADAAGVTAVLVTEPVGDLYNPNTIRASLGTVFRLPVITCSNQAAQVWLEKNRITPWAAIVGAATHYTKIDWTGPSAMVLGSEAHGLSNAWRIGHTTGIHLPMAGFADSLNVSTSAAILMYEAVRQRTASPPDASGKKKV